jgi:dipeptidyl aminopeptidase/acylaminoacyl peptidase
MRAHEWLQTLTVFLVAVSVPSAALAEGKQTLSASGNIAAEDVERLLAEPACFESVSDSRPWDNIQDFPVPSNGITLSAELYLPRGEGPWPAVILVPGGFNETELIMQVPRREAPHLAQCGFAAVVYYKRGTGPSGGSYADATYDDFIDDVGSIARQPARHPSIDRARIGASGGSAGGFVASVAAARYPEVSFIVNKSGPIVPMEEENDFNIAYALRFRGYADSLVERVLPLWRRHHAAWARADTAALEAVAAEILALRTRYDPLLLPTPYNEVFTDSNLVFPWPKFRSASRDYLAEMKTMRKKWLSIYGEKDAIVPVRSCIRNIEALMKASKNEAYAVIVLPGVDHSFFRAGTRDQVPVLRIVVNWLAANVGKK